MMFSMILEALERRAMMSAAAVVAPPAQVATAGTTESATTAPTTASGVTAFSWAPTKDSSSIQSAIWASLDQDPVAEAQRVSPLLMQRPAGDRAIFLWHSMVSAFNINFANPSTFVASGPNISHDQLWAQKFFGELKTLGAQVDRVATDDESGFSTWVIFAAAKNPAQQVAIMTGIYNNPAAFAKLPASVKAFTPADFASQFTPRGYGAYLAWNNWAQSVGEQAWKNAVVTPLQQNFGTAVAVSNYQDIGSKTQVLDENGWPLALANSTAPGNVSSPSAYLTGGNKYAGMQKNWQWNRLIDVLNTIRAIEATPNSTVTPWISFPSFKGTGVPLAQSTWLWEQMVRQMVAGGVSSFYYWNPAPITPRSDDQFADALFKSLTPGTPTAADLQPIPFDANQIVTGGVVTTYADFLKFVNMPGATDMNPVVPAAPPAQQSQVTPASGGTQDGSGSILQPTDVEPTSAPVTTTPAATTPTTTTPSTSPLTAPTVVQPAISNYMPTSATMFRFHRPGGMPLTSSTLNASITTNSTNIETLDDLLDSLGKL